MTTTLRQIVLGVKKNNAFAKCIFVRFIISEKYEKWKEKNSIREANKFSFVFLFNFFHFLAFFGARTHVFETFSSLFRRLAVFYSNNASYTPYFRLVWCGFMCALHMSYYVTNEVIGIQLISYAEWTRVANVCSTHSKTNRNERNAIVVCRLWLQYVCINMFVCMCKRVNVVHVLHLCRWRATPITMRISKSVDVGDAVTMTPKQTKNRKEKKLKNSRIVCSVWLRQTGTTKRYNENGNA